MEKLLQLATIFKKYSQALELGQSTLNRQQIKEKASDWKTYIESVKDEIPKRSGWGGKEGQLALIALTRILNDQNITSDDVARAYMDVYTNFRDMNEKEFKYYLDSYRNL